MLENNKKKKVVAQHSSDKHVRGRGTDPEVRSRTTGVGKFLLSKSFARFDVVLIYSSCRFGHYKMHVFDAQLGSQPKQTEKNLAAYLSFLTS